MRTVRFAVVVFLVLFASTEGHSRGPTALPASEPESHGTWLEIPSPLPPPSSRDYPTSLVYDTVREQLIVYHTSYEGGTPELWALPAGVEEWHQILPSGLPPNVLGSVIVFDSHGDRVILFGGVSATTGVATDEVWEMRLSGSPHWNQLNPTGNPPPPGDGYSAAYDSRDQRLLVFNGTTAWYLEFSDPPGWDQIEATGTPPNRAGNSAFYDPHRHQLLIVYPNPNALAILTLGGNPTWTQYQESPSSISPWVHFAYDAPQDRVLAVDERREQVSELSLPVSGDYSWQYVAPAPTRFEYSVALDKRIAFDPLRNRLLVHNPVSSRTWVLPAGHQLWTELARYPQPRYGHAAVYDPVRERMLVLSGVNGTSSPVNGPPYSTYDTDVWGLSLNGPVKWALTGLSSPGVAAHTAAYDPIGDRVIGIGGVASRPVWECHDPPHTQWYYQSSWTVPLSGQPAAALARGPIIGGHSAAYDSRRHQLVVFGGGRGSCHCDYSSVSYGEWVCRGTENQSLYFVDLENPSEWGDILLPEGVPRSGRASVYDEDRDRIWVIDRGNDSADLWWTSAAQDFAWSQIVPSGEVSGGFTNHTLIYDPVRERLILFGGQSGPTESSSVWALDLTGEPRWEQLIPSGQGPGAIQGHSAIYDPVRDQMVVYGPGRPGQAWILRWGDPLRRVTIQVRPAVRGAAQGKVPVGILSDPSFDARTLDLESLSISGVSPIRAGNGSYLSATLDLNGDRLPDLQVFFPSEVVSGALEADWVRLDGRTQDGQRIRGSTSLRTAPPGVAYEQGATLHDLTAELRLEVRLARGSPVVGRQLGPVLVTVPKRGNIRLEVFSADGRRLHAQESGLLVPGTHRIDLDGLGSIAPGVYWLRLRQLDESVTCKAVVIP